MKWLEVKQSKPLMGSIKSPGSKNSTLGLLAACCLGKGDIHIENVPDILDVNLALDICRDIGLKFQRVRNDLFIKSTNISPMVITETKRRVMNRL